MCMCVMALVLLMMMQNTGAILEEEEDDERVREKGLNERGVKMQNRRRG